MAKARSGGRSVRETQDSKSSNDPLKSLRTRRAIADLREQLVITVALLDQAQVAGEAGQTDKFRELFQQGHEACRSARERARAIDERVSPRTGRRAGGRKA